MHEEIARGTMTELLADFHSRDAVRGEITIVLGAPRVERDAADPAEIRAAFERLRAEGMRRNDAVKVVAERFGLRKNDVYRMLR
jgi:16S rRNA (cytidine1402-2'-O)-methyltransferase